MDSKSNVVLVVDDNPTIHKFIASDLVPLGYQVEWAKDGVDALTRMLKGPVDLILLDMVMPRMNGYHFCKMLQQKDMADVPIVLMSSVEDRVASRMKEHTTIRDFLPKPIDWPNLRTVVQKHLPLPHSDGERYLDVPDKDIEWTSDDAIDTDADLIGLLREKLDTAVVEELSWRLDPVVDGEKREELFGLMAEALAASINDDLLNHLVDIIRGLDQRRM